MLTYNDKTMGVKMCISHGNKNITFIIFLIILALISTCALYATIRIGYIDDSKTFDNPFTPKFIFSPNDAYSILEYDKFLTPDECDTIIDIARRKGLSASLVYAAEADKLNNDVRISEQTWLNDDIDIVTLKIAEFVSKVTRMPIANQEQLQVVRYPEGGKFTPHYDPCNLDQRSCIRMDGDAGPRIYTFLIYLNDDFEGGHTIFPFMNISIKPQKGKAILFQSKFDDLAMITESKHGGDVVYGGEKWICNKWVRLNAYNP